MTNNTILISFCISRDLDVWCHSHQAMLKFIQVDCYVVVVPDEEVYEFRSNTDHRFQVLPESIFRADWQKPLEDKFSLETKNRFGWYKQQFLKLAALDYFRKEFDGLIIFDSDTMPLSDMSFFIKGKPVYFVSKENHPQYFDTLQKIFGFGKLTDFSFISQCFPVRSYHLDHFFDFFLPQQWWSVLLDKVDFNSRSSFSEYETLGNYIHKYFLGDYITSNALWYRFGYDLGKPSYVFRKYSDRVCFNFVAFEKWAKNRSLLHRIRTRLIFFLSVARKHLN